MSWSEKFLDEVGIRGEQIPRFSSPSKTAYFSLRPRVCSDYFSLEDMLDFLAFRCLRKISEIPWS